MTNQEALMAFSQSEKIKAGLIWVSQSLEYLNAFPDNEKAGGEKVLAAVLEMIFHDLELAKRVAADPAWEKAESMIEQGLVMIRSHAAAGAVHHLTQALSQVTGIGHRSMTSLKESGLL